MTDLADLLSTPPAWGVVLLVFAALLLVQRLVIGKAGLFSEPTPFLQADQWKGLPLVDKLVLNHNTRQFRCGSVARYCAVCSSDGQSMHNGCCVLLAVRHAQSSPPVQ